MFVAGQFHIVGQTRSDVGEDWGLLLSWCDRDSRAHRWAIPLRLIHRHGNEIAEELESAGLSCGNDENAHRLLKRFLSMVKITRRLRCVSRTGWHDGGTAPVFVLPGGEAFGRDAADVILQADRASADAAFRATGTMPDWQDKVAALAVGNDRLVLFMSAAFAGPLLEVLAEPSGGIHLVGEVAYRQEHGGADGSERLGTADRGRPASSLARYRERAGGGGSRNLRHAPDPG